MDMSHQNVVIPLYEPNIQFLQLRTLTPTFLLKTKTLFKIKICTLYTLLVKKNGIMWIIVFDITQKNFISYTMFQIEKETRNSQVHKLMATAMKA